MTILINGTLTNCGQAILWPIPWYLEPNCKSFIINIYTILFMILFWKMFSDMFIPVSLCMNSFNTYSYHSFHWCVHSERKYIFMSGSYTCFMCKQLYEWLWKFSAHKGEFCEENLHRTVSFCYFWKFIMSQIWKCYADAFGFFMIWVCTKHIAVLLWDILLSNQMKYSTMLWYFIAMNSLTRDYFEYYRSSPLTVLCGVDLLVLF